jgi:hypothetical protein
MTHIEVMDAERKKKIEKLNEFYGNRPKSA